MFKVASDQNAHTGVGIAIIIKEIMCGGHPEKKKGSSVSGEENVCRLDASALVLGFVCKMGLFVVGDKL